MFEEDREFVIKELGLTDSEFESIMAAPVKTFWDYPSYEKGATYRSLRFFYRLPRTIQAAMRGEIERPPVSVSGTLPGPSAQTETAGVTENHSKVA